MDALLLGVSVLSTLLAGCFILGFLAGFLLTSRV